MRGTADPDRLTGMARAYGMFNYLDTHNTYAFHLGRLAWDRIWKGHHHGGPRIPWLLYARSGEPKYLRWAARRSQHNMDLNHVHHTTPYARFLPYPAGKVKGAQNDYKGFAHWYTGCRLFDYNNVVDYLFYDYYLTGNRRALDVAHLWGEAVLAEDLSLVPGQGRAGAGVISALCFLYEETGDRRFLPYIRRAAQAMFRGQMEDGYWSTFWTTFAPWRGRYIRAMDGDPSAVESLRRWCDNVVEWRYSASDTWLNHRPTGGSHTPLNTFPLSKDLASGYFLADRNADYLRFGLGDLEMFSWAMYEGEGHPQYRGYSGLYGSGLTLPGYFLQTAPYLLRALAEHGEPVEPLYRRAPYASPEGVSAYLDVQDRAVLNVCAMIHLAQGWEYELRLEGPGGETFGPVPIEIQPQQPQAVEWASPRPVAAGEWKLTLAGKQPTILVRLHVPEAARITYRLLDETFFRGAPAIYFLGPQNLGALTWEVQSIRNEPAGGVLICPGGEWAGRATWLDLHQGAWNEVSAEIKPEQAGKPWLLGAGQCRAMVRRPGSVPPFFAYTREDLFLPERP